MEIRSRKDGIYAERAEHPNREVQIRLLLELVDEMVKNSLPEGTFFIRRSKNYG